MDAGVGGAFGFGMAGSIGEEIEETGFGAGLGCCTIGAAGVLDRTVGVEFAELKSDPTIATSH